MTKVVEIQVVLEYQWTPSSTRELISNVQAEQIVTSADAAAAAELQVKDGPAEGQSVKREIITNEVTLRSVVESLAAKGLDIEPEYRISF